MRLFPGAERRFVGLVVKGLIFAGVAWSLWLANSANTVGVELRASAAEPDTRSELMLYAKYCARCHQADGSGGANRSAEFPNFTLAAWQRERSDIQMLISIREGKGRAMPGFGDRLSHKELEEMAAYIRTFAPSSRGDRSRTQNADFDARFHKLELELAELRREFWELHASSDEN
jgi:mono/diheme cytochrome c family protein